MRLGTALVEGGGGVAALRLPLRVEEMSSSASDPGEVGGGERSDGEDSSISESSTGRLRRVDEEGLPRALGFPRVVLGRG